jgi:hypothetical protein
LLTIKLITYGTRKNENIIVIIRWWQVGGNCSYYHGEGKSLQETTIADQDSRLGTNFWGAQRFIILSDATRCKIKKQNKYTTEDSRLLSKGYNIFNASKIKGGREFVDLVMLGYSSHNLEN